MKRYALAIVIGVTVGEAIVIATEAARPEWRHAAAGWAPVGLAIAGLLFLILAVIAIRLETRRSPS